MVFFKKSSAFLTTLKSFHVFLFLGISSFIVQLVIIAVGNAVSAGNFQNPHLAKKMQEILKLSVRISEGPTAVILN